MVGGDYPLKGGDALSITIFGGVEKQMETTIGPDGYATIEMAGRVSLAGKTLDAKAKDGTFEFKKPEGSFFKVIGTRNF